MTRYRDAAIVPVDATRRVAPTDGDDPAEPAVGRWYWVKEEGKKKSRWLGCVVHVGSNYVKLEGVNSHVRVHFDAFFDRCEYVADAEAVIAGEVNSHSKAVRALMTEVRAVTAALAITTGPALPAASTTDALALSDSGRDMDDYKKALVCAEKKTLPELFAKIKSHNEMLGKWLSARIIPMEAEARAMEPAIAVIKQRIFSVELYAGLVEQVEQVAEGEPAAVTEKVHLMQRRCYMDEECLARYEVGGMEFKNLPSFDRWLAKPENRDRILPFQRCLVAFRVRRHEKERDPVNLSEFFKFNEASKLDKLTFLYVRNGDQLFRLSTEVEFDAKLFPDIDRQILARRARAEMFAGEVKKVISEDEWQAMVDEEERKTAENEKKPEKDRWHVYRESHRYEPFDRSSVHYDDIVSHIQDEMAKHNQLVLVLQGLLDRSPVLHPHPPWRIWTNEGFEAALVLVHDDSRTLSAGDAPDFEAYRQKLNASLAAGSVTVGQEIAWEEREAERENELRSRRGSRHESYLRRYRPYGDPGPGTLATAVDYTKRSKTASYAWEREHKSYSREERPAVRCTLAVPADRLMNVSAYEPGDFRKFFDDPRTRADYMEWAPFLLVAEEYHAGNRKVAKAPPPMKPKKPSYDGKLRYQRLKEQRAMVGKIVGLRRQVTMKSGKKYEKDTLWLASRDSGGTIHLSGCDADGVLTADGRGISKMAVRDVYVVGTPKEKSE